MQDGAITDAIAEKALSVSGDLVASMKEATSSGQTSDILAATIDVYRGVTEYVNSQTSASTPKEQEIDTAAIQKLKLDLKTRAGQFCDALTDDSAPDAAPLESSTSDFLFSCQKVQKRGRGSEDDEDDNLVLLLHIYRFSAARLIMVRILPVSPLYVRYRYVLPLRFPLCFCPHSVCCIKMCRHILNLRTN